MTESLDVASPDTMRELQGSQVLVNSGSDAAILTIVRLVDKDEHKLLLVNKSSKEKESWDLTQEFCDLLQPHTMASQPGVRWKLTL